MQRKNKKDIWIFIILIPIFLWLSLNFSGDKNDKTIPYSVLNKGSKGVSVMYEAMKKLNYPVEMVFENIEDKGYGEVQFVIASKYNSSFNLNDDDIKSWIKKGGKLVCLDEYDEKIEYGEEIDSFNTSNDKGASVFSYGDGVILIGNSELIINKTLAKDTDGAYWILSQIDKWQYDAVKFNEFYNYSTNSEKSLWSDIPNGIKFMLYQLIFFIGAIIFYKGKRFGKPIPLYEEVERTENEYILSAASLYQKAGCWEEALENYYKDFLLETEKVFGNNESLNKQWLMLWEKKKLPKLNKAKELYNFMNNKVYESGNKKKKAKKYIEIISIIEQLKKILIKRREDHWKRLKKDTQRI